MVVVVVRVIVAMVVGEQRRPGEAVLAAEGFVAAGAVAVTAAGTIFQAAADALDMVVVALLREADLGLKA